MKSKFNSFVINVEEFYAVAESEEEAIIMLIKKICEKRGIQVKTIRNVDNSSLQF